MAQMARRVIGYGDGLPPYEGSINKFRNANTFEEAFGLYSNKRINSRPKPKSRADGFELGELA
jgi:hypothetical protein